MLCQKCGEKNATVHLIQNVNGNKSDLWLCEKCAGGAQNSFFGLNAGSLFSDFFSDSMFGISHPETTKKCPVCGFTTSDLAEAGRPGCPECYNVFEAEIDRMVKNVHGNTKHCGSVPGKHSEKNEIKRQIEALKKEQAEAIKVQNYEKAAELRDKIKALEAGKDGKDGK